MKKVRSALTYANVVATIALFLALSGGVVYAASQLGKNSVKSQNLATHAVKNRNLAKNAVKAQNIAANAVTAAKLKAGSVTGGKVKNGTLTRSNLASGTLAGLQVLDASAASVPGLTTEVVGGTPVPLSGTSSFTPLAGKSYELLAELSGNPVDADGASGSKVCIPRIEIRVNGVPFTNLWIWANAEETAPYNYEPIGTSSTAIALQHAGQAQAISAVAFGREGCGAGTAGSLRVVVVELG